MKKEDIEEIIKKEKPNLKQTSINQYVRSLITLHKKLITSGEDEDYMDLFKDTQKVKDALSDYSSTTARNFYTSLITILGSEERPNKKVIREYELIVKGVNEEYIKKNDEGYISDKQGVNFVGVDKLDELIRKLKEEKKEMAYILFQILKQHHIRNEIATLVSIPLVAFNKLKKDDKKGNNYLVVGSKKLLISRNDYKTIDKYGEIVFEITDKKLVKDIRKYLKDLPTSEVFVFNEDNTTADKKQQLSNYLSYWSEKYIKVKLSTTLIAKIMLSHKHLETKIAQEKDSKERGHSAGVQNSIYIKKIKNTEEVETIPADTESKV